MYQGQKAHTPIIGADIRQHCLDTACQRLGAHHGILLPDANVTINFMAYTVIRKEVEIISTFMGNEVDTLRAIELAESKQIDHCAIVTHQLPIESAQHGMELAITKNEHAIKVVLTH